MSHKFGISKSLLFPHVSAFHALEQKIAYYLFSTMLALEGPVCLTFDLEQTETSQKQ